LHTHTHTHLRTFFLALAFSTHQTHAHTTHAKQYTFLLHLASWEVEKSWVKISSLRFAGVLGWRGGRGEGRRGNRKGGEEREEEDRGKILTSVTV